VALYKRQQKRKREKLEEEAEAEVCSGRGDNRMVV